MFYAVLKSIHLLSLLVWVGGMFFTLVCLRPALAQLEGPQRVRLMAEVLRRFFGVVAVAIGLMLASGAWLLWIAVRTTTAPGLNFNMSLDWNAMIAIGLVMVAVFGYIRFALFTRLEHAVQSQNWPAGAAVLGRIRSAVLVNLVLGALVVVVMRVGGAA